MWHPFVAMPQTPHLLLLLCIALCVPGLGCPGEGGLLADDDDSTAPVGDDDDDSTSEPPTPTVPTQVTFTAGDGVELRGTWQPAPGVTDGPAVLMLHELGGSRQDFTLIWEVFQSNGISTLAFDFRGHGASGDAGVPLSDLRNTPGLLEADVRAAMDLLADQEVVDTGRIGVLGLDVGANLAVLGLHESRQGSSDPWGIDGITAITPSIAEIEAVGELASGDLVLAGAQYVAGENAPEDAADATALHDGTTEPRDLRIVLGTSAHGADMLTGSSDARNGIVQWFVTLLE
jgi:dienelactone hydrolase